MNLRTFVGILILVKVFLEGIDTLTERLLVDYQGLTLYPADASGNKTYPVTVRADGNCLPGCGSIFSFGNDQQPAELRACIVHEFALNYYHNLNGDSRQHEKIS